MKTNNKTDLVEIKKDKTGHGLLIEHDGYISMSEGQNKKLMESIDSSDNWHCPYPFIVHAVFQKAGIKNANGRIYPRNVLEKQVELYQQRIAEKRALGECYTPDVLVLTEKGWKELREIKEGENILTLNTDTDEIEIKPVLRKIEKDFDGNMIEIRSRNILDLVTPNHEFPLYSRNHKYIGSYSAKDILDNKIEDIDNLYIPCSFIEGSIPKCELHECVKSELNKIDNDSKEIFLGSKDINISEVPYKGEVMCLEVENHTFYVMSNGHCHWSHNCNHPAESVIDLGRISHNIIELHWEGNTVVGQLELNLSPGYVKYGICSTLGDTTANLLLNGYKIGVSSRGVGSVEQKMGVLMVGDDFELICWDVVSDPSTPSAYIGNSREELQPYVESVDKKSKNIVLEKVDRIKGILRG